MYGGLNARGLNSLSNGISSASDLPPLNPSSGTIYQPPNSTGSRNAVIETQRMRTYVMGQIQTIQSDQDRKMQQSEARISMVLRELTPKIQNLDRHNVFNQQQLDDIVERLSQLDSSVVPSIQQKSDEIQLKFDQSIRAETQSKLKPISDDIKHEQSKFDQLSDSATTRISNTNDKLKELSLLYDELEKQVSDNQSYVQGFIINVNPRLSTIESRLIAYENAAENSIKNQNSQSDFQLSAKKMRKDLQDLEVDGISLAVRSAAQDILASITTYTSQIDQKITSSKMLLSNMDHTIKMTKEQQRNVDLQVESLSKSSIDVQTTIQQKEDDINSKLEELESSIKEINAEIGKKLNTYSADSSGNGQKVLDSLGDDIRSLRTNARQLLTQLKEDWNQFHDDNGKVQKITNSEIEQISSIMNGEFSLLKKIDAAEKRARWCSNRLLVWQREVEEAEHLKVDDDQLIQKLEMLETKLKETEKRLEKFDQKQAPKNKKKKKDNYHDIGPTPPLADPGNEIEPLEIPSELKLTYNENDTEITLSDLSSHEESKKPPSEDENDTGMAASDHSSHEKENNQSKTNSSNEDDSINNSSKEKGNDGNGMKTSKDEDNEITNQDNEITDDEDNL